MQIDNLATTNLQKVPPLSTGRALILFNAISDLVPVGEAFKGSRAENENAPSHRGLFNARSVSPREISEFSLELYAMGVISFDDYSALAYHPELHPGYDDTIGALTGEMADPDRKRDLIAEWEDKNRFLKCHSPMNTTLISQSGRITGILRSLTHPPPLTDG